MAMTIEDLTQYLKQNPVTLGWASLTVVELEAAAARLSELFRARPLSHLVLKPFDIAEFATSPNERVSFQGLRLGTPQLKLAVDTSGARPAGEMVLFIPLVGGRYSVTTVAGTVRYLYERITLAEHQGYGLSVRFSLSSLNAYARECRVYWEWSLDQIKSFDINLGTTAATRQAVANALQPYANDLGMLKSPTFSHSLPERVEGPLTPVNLRMSVTDSKEGDGVYALNLFASTVALPEVGALPGPDFPFLLPKNAAGRGYGADAAFYAASDLAPFVEQTTAGLAEGLLSLITPTPVLDLAKADAIEGAVDQAYLTKLPVFEPQVLAGLPQMSPTILTRLLSANAASVDAQNTHAYAAEPITFQAGGLGSGVRWTYTAWAAQGVTLPDPVAVLTPSADGRSATLQVARELVSGHYQLRVKAQDVEGEAVQADLILRPANLSAWIDPPVASIDADRKAFFEVFDILPNLQVLGEDQGQVQPTEEGFVYRASGGSEEGAAVVLADSSSAAEVGTNAPSVRYGLGVVDLTPPAPTPSRWIELNRFSLEARQGNRVYANGRQQLEVTITVGTTQVGGRYIPLSQAEMNRLELFIKGTTLQPIPFLAPGEEEIPSNSTLDYAQSFVRNGAYRFYPGSATLLNDIAAEQEEGERTARLYVMTQASEAVTLVARFTSDTGQVYTSYYEDKINGEISVQGIRPPTFTAGTYAFEPQVIGTPFPGTCVINGTDVSDCFRSVTYWKLVYQDSSVTRVPFVRLQFERNTQADTGEQPFPRQSLMRWASDRMAEIFFSYTGYAFAPARADGIQDSDFDATAMYYDPLLAWFMTHRHPGQDDTSALDLHVRNAAGTPSKVEAGQLWIGLYRDDQTLYWSDIDSDNDEDEKLRGHRFATFGAHLNGVNLPITLIDQDGNNHALSVDFGAANGSSSRDALRIDVRGAVSN